MLCSPRTETRTDVARMRTISVKLDRQCVMLRHKSAFLEQINCELQAQLEASDVAQLQLRSELEAQVRHGILTQETQPLGGHLVIIACRSVIELKQSELRAAEPPLSNGHRSGCSGGKM